MLFLIFLDWALDVNTKVLCFPSCHSMLVLEARAVFQQGKGTEVPDQPSLMSPSSVVQAVNARLSEQLENPPGASKSGRRSILSRDTLLRRALTYADNATEGAIIEGDGNAQDRAGIAHKAIPAKDVDVKNILLAAGKTISDVESDVSSLERVGEDGGDWVDADAYNDDICKSLLDYVND